MKEVIGKGKLVNNSLPNISFSTIGTFLIKRPKYFVSVGLKLACEISQPERSFQMYLKESDSSFEEVTLSDEEIKTAFFPLRGGKSPSFDESKF